MADEECDAEGEEGGAAAPDAALNPAQQALQALFGEEGEDDSDAEAGGGGGRDSAEALATARSLKAKEKSELKQRLQRLAQGKKAETGAARRAGAVDAAAAAARRGRTLTRLAAPCRCREEDQA